MPLVTNRQDITLGVLAQIIAGFIYAQTLKIQSQKRRTTDFAAHAGWRGALSGLFQTTVKALVDLGAAKNQINALDRASDFATKL